MFFSFKSTIYTKHKSAHLIHKSQKSNIHNIMSTNDNTDNIVSVCANCGKGGGCGMGAEGGVELGASKNRNGSSNGMQRRTSNVFLSLADGKLYG